MYLRLFKNSGQHAATVYMYILLHMSFRVCLGEFGGSLVSVFMEPLANPTQLERNNGTPEMGVSLIMKT